MFHHSNAANASKHSYTMQKYLLLFMYMHKVILRRTILSRTSEVEYPTNPPWAPGSDKTWGQGSFGLFTAITTYTKI